MQIGPNEPLSQKPQAVVLIGFMGSGKSSVARLLARRLKRQLIDLDHHIEQVTGQSVAEIFATRGEPAFRRIETQALQEALKTANIISCGGGTLTQAVNRDLLRVAAQQGAVIIYLRATAATLAERIRRQPGKRPLIDGNSVLDEEGTRARVQQLLTQREEHYKALCNVTLDTDSFVLEDIVDQIQCVLEHRPWLGSGRDFNGGE